MLVSRLFNRFLAFLGEFMQALGTLVAAIALEDFLAGKVVVSKDGAFQEVVTNIKVGLPDKIWLVTGNPGHECKCLWSR